MATERIMVLFYYMKPQNEEELIRSVLDLNIGIKYKMALCGGNPYDTS